MTKLKCRTHPIGLIAVYNEAFAEFYWETTGTWDESSQTFTFKGRLGADDTGTMTATLRFSDEATFVYSLVATDSGGKVNYHMEGKAVRRK